MTEYTEADIFRGEINYARQGIPTANFILKDSATDVAPDDTVKISGVYTTKDSRIYPASYTFKDDIIGDNPTGWTITESTNYTVQVIRTLDEHYKIVEMYDNDGTNQCIISITITSQTTLKIEFWYHTTDITKRAYFSVYDSTPTECQFQVNNITGTVNDTWHHLTYIIDTSADTYDLYLDGVQKQDGTALPTSINAVVKIEFKTHGTDNGYYVYWDAIGGSWDGTYVLGDNVWWEHYTDEMSEADFESEELYTSSTSINFVDTDNSGATATVEIVPDLSAHKRVLKVTNTIADNVDIYNTLSGNIEYGTVEFYVECSDVTRATQFILYDGVNPGPRILLFNEYISYYDGSTHTILSASDNRNYHIKWTFECTTGTYDDLAQYKMNVYINGVKYGPYPFHNNVAHVDNFRIWQNTNSQVYSARIDAMGFSWESDYDVGDNSIKITPETVFNTIIFEGTIEDVDMQAAQGIYCVSVSQELLDRVKGTYGGFTDSAVGKVCYDNSSLVVIERTTEQFELGPDGDVSDGSWEDTTGGNSDTNLYNEIDDNPCPSVATGDYIQTTVSSDTCEFTLDTYASFDPTKHYVIEEVKAKFAHNSSGGTISNYFYDGVEWVDGESTTSGTSGSRTATINPYRTHEEVPNFKTKFTSGTVSGNVRVYGFRLEASISEQGVTARCYENDGRIEQGGVKVRISSQGESSVVDILNLCALSELNTWYLCMNHQVFFNGGDHKSGIQLANTDNIGNIQGSRKIKSYDKVILYGGYVGGSQISATSGSGNTIAHDTYSEVLDTAILQDLADQLLIEKGSNTYYITLTLVDSTIGVPQVGETINFASGIKFNNSDKTIPAGDYIVDEVRYTVGEDGVYQQIELSLIDILMFSLTEEQQLALVGKHANQNTNLISQVV